jgi:hypothetical protein
MSIRKQAAERLGKSERQVKSMIANGKLPKPSQVGEGAFFAAIDDYLLGGDLKQSIINPRNGTKEAILDTQHITSLDNMLDLMEIDKDAWDVDKVTCNYYGKPGNANLQLKAMLKRNERIDEQFIIDVFKKLKAPKKFAPVKSKWGKGDCMLKVNMHDLHYGKLCWAPESGENYDSKIASQRFMDALKTFIKHAQHYPVSEILFPVGNDFFNSDGVEMATTAGTGQHDDGRWQKTYHEGVSTI